MKKINIEELHSIKKPLYVLVAGGIGAGKSYVVSKYLNGIKVIDPDETTIRLGNGVYDSSNVSKSISITKEKVEKMLKGDKSFVQQGTSANLQSTINKMKKAKEHNFTTVLLYIDTDIDTAVKNVSMRTSRSEIPIKKIERTASGAKHTFDFITGKEISISATMILENLDMSINDVNILTDYAIHYKND